MKLWSAVRNECAGAWRSVQYDLARRRGGPTVAVGPDYDPFAGGPRRVIVSAGVAALVVGGAAGSYLGVVNGLGELLDRPPAPAVLPVVAGGADGVTTPVAPSTSQPDGEPAHPGGPPAAPGRAVGRAAVPVAGPGQPGAPAQPGVPQPGFPAPPGAEVPGPPDEPAPAEEPGLPEPGLPEDPEVPVPTSGPELPCEEAATPDPNWSCETPPPPTADPSESGGGWQWRDGSWTDGTRRVGDWHRHPGHGWHQGDRGWGHDRHGDRHHPRARGHHRSHTP